MSNGWRTATLETQDEYDFIMQGHKTFCNSYPYWINGSTDTVPDANLNYSDYFPNNTGILMALSGKGVNILQENSYNYSK